MTVERVTDDRIGQPEVRLSFANLEAAITHALSVSMSGDRIAIHSADCDTATLGDCDCRPQVLTVGGTVH